MRVPVIGEPVNLRMCKWDGSPHRQTTLAYLGSDEYGRWFTIPGGVRVPQPGTSSVGRATHVMLLPHDGRFLAHFNAPTAHNHLYADITTPPELRRVEAGWVIDVIDMDLDVVHHADGRIWIEDEEEFADHTDHYGYSPDLVAATRRAADALLAAVRNNAEPFGTTWRGWIDRVDATDANT